MNGRELGKYLAERYGQKIVLGQFANPLFHPCFNTQFIYDSGFPHAPLTENHTDILFPDPYAGPFYDLPVIGLIPLVDDERFAIRVLVQMPHSLYNTSPFYVECQQKDIEGLAGDLGINWYAIDSSSSTQKYMEMASLVDCVENGRKTT